MSCMKANMPALDGGVVEVGVEHARGVRAPRPEQVLVLGGDPEQLADHRDRQRVAETGDEVEAGRVDVVEHPVDQVRHVRPELLHGAGREGLAHQLAEPRVVGRVHEQHRARSLDAGGQLEEGQLQPALGGVGAHRRVAQDPLAVLEAREDELVPLRDRPDGRSARIRW